MKLTEKRIEEIKNNGYQLEFENVFNHAFENYKKIALYAGLALFVFSVVIGIAAIAIISFYFGIAFLNEKLAENLKIETLSGIYLARFLLLFFFLLF
jgi:ABC-type microcin C transport system permease subunit YejE